MKKVLRIGTRGSKLALVQARWVMDEVRRQHPGIDVREVIIRTQGDQVQDRPLATIGEKGVFVKELESALERGEIDAAVHSLKDLPSRLSEGFEIGAVPLREDPRDCLISPKYRELRNLPSGAVVGTGSPRRKAQILSMRPDLDVRDIRGNVDTRLNKASRGEYDAIVLAAAGLSRLGMLSEVHEFFETDEMTPAVGQAALAVEIRRDDSLTREALAFLDDTDSRLAVTAERELATLLGASCEIPLGAYAQVSDSMITMRAVLSDEDGTGLVVFEGSSDRRKWQALALEAKNHLQK